MHLLASLLLPGAALATATYDYVIVGGGTCGLLLANRLSEDSDVSVAVIDPGPDRRGNEMVEDPSQWLSLTNTSLGLNWDYKSAPQVHAGNRSIDMNAGYGLGGTSLINGMTYIRGDKAQFDAWEALGNEGWNWETMYKHYKEVEKFFKPTKEQAKNGGLYDAEYHGEDGLLHVGFTPVLQNGSIYDDSKKAWGELGEDLNKDMNGGSTEGFGVWPQTLDPVKNRRSDSATTYLWPVEERSNLHLINGTVAKVLWKKDCDTPEASGVQYVNPNNEELNIRVGKEVILSAGSLRTPLILENSGVGNPDLLDTLGIDTVIKAPSVGENMIDQPNNAMVYNATTGNLWTGYTPYGTFVSAKDLFGKDVDKVAQDTKKSIPQYAQQMVAASNGSLSASALEKIFQIQHDVMFEEDTTIGEILMIARQAQLFSAFWDLLPFGRGSVHLGSASDTNIPVIDPRYFSTDIDRQVQIATARMSASFWATQPIADLIDAPVAALPPNSTDTQWLAFLAKSVSSNSHYIGTAAMMSKELGGVVDAQLKVYGAKGLRVVDASVLPMQISGHLTATLYAIAQRASEMIRAEQ